MPRRADLPLFEHFPALAGIPRTALGTFPTPVERHEVAGHVLLVKRDDLSGPVIGGNKVRGLEWLLGGLANGERVLTVGPTGSTHALATAVYAQRLGAQTTVVRWRQEMNPAARAVDPAIRRAATVLDARWVASAYAVAAALRATGRFRWIPAGGASALALLGHVNAGLELAGQVRAGACEEPRRLYVPFGTGGTAAGLALGLKIARMPTVVVAVRVVPRIMGTTRRLLRLARAAAALIVRRTGARVPRVQENDVLVEHSWYGGAYGRALAAAPVLAGLPLDDTYSRKAFAAAAAAPRESLFWLTFDARVLQTPEYRSVADPSR